MYSVKPKVFRYCAVPQCENTTIETPTKLFITLPRKGRLRDQWLKLARRDPNSLPRDTRLYFCQDHFDLPRDMRNFDDYCMGYASQIQLKNYCVPSKFECQTGKEGEKQKELLNVKSYQGRKKASSAKSTTTSKSIPGETSGANTDEGCLKLNVPMDVVDSAGHMTGDKYCFCCLSYKCSLISTSNCSHYDHYIKYMDVKNLNSDHHVCVMCHEMLKKIEKFNNMVIESNHTIASKLDITNSGKKEFIDLQISTTPTSIETLYHVSISTQHMEPDFTLPVRKRPTLTINKKQKTKPKIITNHSLPVTKYKIVANDKLQEIVPVERSDNIMPVIKHEIVDEDFIDDSCLHFENTPVKIEPFSTSVLTEIEILPELPAKQETKEISPQFEGKVRYVCLSQEEYEKEREVLESTDQVYRSSDFRCKSCVIGFPNLNKYQTHMNLDHGYSELVNKVQCTICDLLVNPPLVEHERIHFSRQHIRLSKTGTQSEIAALCGTSGPRPLPRRGTPRAVIKK